MDAAQKLRRYTKFFALVLFVIVIYAITTSESAMGRRLAKLAAYRWDFRYWPYEYSVVLWAIALGCLSALIVRSEYFRKVVTRILRQRASSEKVDKISTNSLRFIAFFYVIIFGAILCWLFVDITAWLRFLKYKLYADYFQNPISLWLETGRFSAKLLTGPFVVAGVLVLYYLIKKRSKKNLLVFLILCPLASSVAGANESVDGGKNLGKIRLLQPAEYNIERDVQEIAETPSAKNPDGGYDADVSILQCFAAMSYRYTGGRYDDEEIQFRLRAPLRVEPEKKYPLLIWFHGYGESSGENVRHLAHLHHAIASFAGKDALDFYMIAVQCPLDNASWQNSLSPKGKGDSRLVIVSEIMEAVIAEYPIDENRIGVIGISSGATATWDFVLQNPDKIAGLVAFSGTPPTANPQAFQKTSVWAFNNKGDVGTPWKRTADFIDDINEMGGNGYVTLRDHGIHDSWTIPLKSQNVIEWLASQSLDGKGFVQDVSYPKRSWGTIFLAFLLPIAVVTLSIFVFFHSDKA